MNEWTEYSAKTVDEALTNALVELKTTSDKIEYEVLEKESGGFLGMFSKPARINVRLKLTLEDKVRDFLSNVFSAMNLDASFDISYDDEEKSFEVNIVGDDMGVLIGKRGQTLDSLQYLVSLVVNKDSEEYIKVKVDTEDYRRRRKETLENLAKNISSRVKRTHRSVALEPMNSFERRIIHSALQNDKYVETHSEGEEPFRKVIVTPKKGADFSNEGGYYKKKNFGSKGGYHKNYKGGYNKKPYNSGYKKYHNDSSATRTGNQTESDK